MSTYNTWEWDKETGSGKSMTFKPCRHDPINRQETEAGYVVTAPEDSRGSWVFKIAFTHLSPSQFLYVVNFLHDNRGVPFYFRWPFEIADIPDISETGEPGGLEPWDSEVPALAGHGPTFLVYCLTDDIQYERKNTPQNYYTMSEIELRQV